jgi:two-component system, NtrC family, sensor histidine kinase PilS
VARNTNASPKAEATPQSFNGTVWGGLEARPFEPSWFVSEHAAEAPPTTELASPPPAPPLRLWSYLMGARVVVAMGLFALQVLAYTQGQGRGWLLGVCAVYLVATAAVLRWSRPARSESVWSAGWALTLWVDLTVFGLLQTAQSSQTLNYTPLFALPVLLASVLGPLLLALGSAAFATLVLLFEAFSADWLHPGGSQTSYVQGAITGAGFFLVALLANQLASRLGREQKQARLHEARAQAESEVNQLIVTGLSEGVLVLDAKGRPWHANPAALAMLGALPLDAQAGAQQPPPKATDWLAQLPQLPAWPLLTACAHNALTHHTHDEIELALPTPQGKKHQVLLRTRITQVNALGSPSACVMFLEDLRDVENRVRIEKLAAMGRISASVAHEIRNPLAAIAQANGLLVEEALTPLQQRLTHMIDQNARRLGRTVDDILEVTRTPAPLTTAVPRLDLDAQVAAWVAEWQEQQGGSIEVQWLAGAGGATVGVDAEHLRRVLVNLLDNALQHGGVAGTRTVHVSTTPHSLTVWNPGPPLPESVAQHLFEPFTSSKSRSSGLGLYLSRELCQRHGAQLDHVDETRNETPGHAFTVTFSPGYLAP